MLCAPPITKSRADVPETQLIGLQQKTKLSTLRNEASEEQSLSADVYIKLENERTKTNDAAFSNSSPF